MSVILSIETASSSCSAALSVNGEISSRSEVGNNIHSAFLLSMVDSLLSDAGLSPQSLDAVVVGQGPGSFTGLRIGVGVGQGLAYGADCPMIGISSLDALALQAASNTSLTTEQTIIAMLDARMGEVYWCEYKQADQGVLAIGDIRVSAPADVLSSNAKESTCVIGNAWQVYAGQFSSLTHDGIVDCGLVYPSATSLLVLGDKMYTQKEWVLAADFMPIYVRNDVAKKSAKKLPGLRVV